MNNTSADALCPVCGQNNQCAIATGKNPSEECWCMTADYLYSKAASPGSKVTVPEAGQTCLCAACLSRLKAGAEKKPQGSS